MSEYGWIIALCGLGLTALGVYAGWVARIMKGEGAADAAKKAQETADKAVADLAAFKEHVAGTYASTTMLDKMESRVVDAINRLGDRLDRIFEPAAPLAPRRARSTRTTS